MSRKICLQNIYKKEGALSLLDEITDEYVRKIFCSGTTFTQKYLERSSGSVRGAYLEFLNNFDLVESIIRAEKEGFDAVVVNCFNDPGVNIAREVVSIPVVGVCESSVHIASMLGGKIAIITNSPVHIPKLAELIERYGLKSKMICKNPIRSCNYIFPTDYIEGIKDPYEMFIPKFERTAKECIQDGADVIIPGCTAAELIFDKVRYLEVAETGVTVVFPFACALKVAESLVDLKKKVGISKSMAEHAPYGRRNTQLINKARKIYGL
jgi:allantoin racemase